jgi:hypothetical protein
MSEYLTSFVLVVWCLAPILIFFALLAATAILADYLGGRALD